MRSEHIRVRTTVEVSERLEQLIEHFQKISINKVTKTDVIEYAINELFESRIKNKGVK